MDATMEISIEKTVARDCLTDEKKNDPLQQKNCNGDR
jgi:hypothetical protein